MEVDPGHESVAGRHVGRVRARAAGRRRRAGRSQSENQRRVPRPARPRSHHHSRRKDRRVREGAPEGRRGQGPQSEEETGRV